VLDGVDVDRWEQGLEGAPHYLTTQYLRRIGSLSYLGGILLSIELVEDHQRGDL